MRFIIKCMTGVPDLSFLVSFGACSVVDGNVVIQGSQFFPKYYRNTTMSSNQSYIVLCFKHTTRNYFDKVQFLKDIDCSCEVCSLVGNVSRNFINSDYRRSFNSSFVSFLSNLSPVYLNTSYRLLRACHVNRRVDGRRSFSVHESTPHLHGDVAQSSGITDGVARCTISGPDVHSNCSDGREERCHPTELGPVQGMDEPGSSPGVANGWYFQCRQCGAACRAHAPDSLVFLNLVLSLLELDYDPSSSNFTVSSCLDKFTPLVRASGLFAGLCFLTGAGSCGLHLRILLSEDAGFDSQLNKPESTLLPDFPTEFDLSNVQYPNGVLCLDSMRDRYCCRKPSSWIGHCWSLCFPQIQISQALPFVMNCFVDYLLYGRQVVKRDADALMSDVAGSHTTFDLNITMLDSVLDRSEFGDFFGDDDCDIDSEMGEVMQGEAQMDRYSEYYINHPYEFPSPTKFQNFDEIPIDDGAGSSSRTLPEAHLVEGDFVEIQGYDAETKKFITSTLGPLVVSLGQGVDACHSVIDWPIEKFSGGIKAIGKSLMGDSSAGSPAGENVQYPDFISRVWPTTVTQIDNAIGNLIKLGVAQREKLKLFENFESWCRESLDEIDSSMKRTLNSHSRAIGSINRKIEDLYKNNQYGDTNTPSGVVDEVVADINKIKNQLKQLSSTISSGSALKDADVITALQKDVDKLERSNDKLMMAINLNVKRIDVVERKLGIRPIIAPLSDDLGPRQIGSGVAQMEENVVVNDGIPRVEPTFLNTDITTSIEITPSAAVRADTSLNDVTTLLSDRYLIGQFHWGTENSRGIAFKSIHFPEALLDSSVWVKLISGMFQYLVCEGVQFDISYTSVGVQGGHLGCFWDGMSANNKLGKLTLWDFNNSDSVFVAGGASGCATLFVPYTSFQERLSINGVNSNTYSFGTLTFIPVNRLITAEGGDQKVGISVYASFKKASLSIRIQPNNLVIPQMENLGGGSLSKLDLESISVKPNFVYLGKWSTSSLGLVATLNVHPCAGYCDGQRMKMTSLAHMASLFHYWQGGLTFEFIFGPNIFCKGKVVFVAVPAASSMEKISSEMLANLPGVVYDLDYGQNVCTVNVPFAGAAEWLDTGYGLLGDYHESILSCSARLFVVVLDPLYANVGSVSEIDFACRVMPGKDFKLQGPRGLLIEHSTLYEAQMDILQDIRTNTTIFGYGNKLVFNVAGHFIKCKLSNERFLSFAVAPKYEKIPITENSLFWISHMFLRWRGSLVYTIVAEAHDVNIQKMVYIWFTPTNRESGFTEFGYKDYTRPPKGCKVVRWDPCDQSSITFRVHYTSRFSSLLVPRHLHEIHPNGFYNGRVNIATDSYSKDLQLCVLVHAGDDFTLFNTGPSCSIGLNEDVLPPKGSLFKDISVTPSIPAHIRDRKKKKVSKEETSGKKKDDTENPTPGEIKEIDGEAHVFTSDGVWLRVGLGEAQMMSSLFMGSKNADILNSLDVKGLVGQLNLLSASGFGKGALDLKEKLPDISKERLESAFCGLEKLVANLSSINISKHVNNDGSLNFGNFDGILSFFNKLPELFQGAIDNTMVATIFKSWKEGDSVATCVILTLLWSVVFIWWLWNRNDMSYLGSFATICCLIWMPVLGSLAVKFMTWCVSQIQPLINQVCEFFFGMKEEISLQQEEAGEINGLASPDGTAQMDSKGFKDFLLYAERIMAIIMSVIVGGASLLACSKIPEFKQIKEFTGKFKFIAEMGKNITGIAGLISLVRQVATWLSTNLCKFLGWEKAPLSLEDKILGHLINFKFSEWVEEVSTMALDENKFKGCSTEENVGKVRTLYDKGLMLQKIMAQTPLPPTITLLIKERFNEVTKLLNETHSAKGVGVMRVDPFHVSLFGAPGVGKSAVTTTLIHDVLDAFDYALTDRVYSRKATDQYWSRYNMEPVVLYDDLGAVVGDQSFSDLSEFIDLKSNQPCPLNMADLESKGKCFVSKFIFSTTNMPYLDNQSNLRNKEAFHRRRNLLVEVRRKEDFILDPDNVSAGLEFRLKDPFIDRPLDLLTHGSWRFEGALEWMEYSQLLNDVILPFTKVYFESQEKLVKTCHWDRLNRKIGGKVTLDERIQEKLNDGSSDTSSETGTGASIINFFRSLGNAQGSFFDNEGSVELTLEQLFDLYDKSGITGRMLNESLEVIGNMYFDDLSRCSVCSIHEHISRVCNCPVGCITVPASECGSWRIKDYLSKCNIFLDCGVLVRHKAKDTFEFRFEKAKVSLNEKNISGYWFLLLCGVIYRFSPTLSCCGLAMIKDEYRVKQVNHTSFDTIVSAKQRVPTLSVEEKVGKLADNKYLIKWTGVKHVYPEMCKDNIWCIVLYDGIDYYFVVSSYIQGDVVLELFDDPIWVEKSLQTLLNSEGIDCCDPFINCLPTFDAPIFRDTIGSMGEVTGFGNLTNNQLEIRNAMRDLYGSQALYCIWLFCVCENTCILKQRSAVFLESEARRKNFEARLLKLKEFEGEISNKASPKIKTWIKVAGACAIAAGVLGMIGGVVGLWKFFHPSEEKENQSIEALEVVEELQNPDELTLLDDIPIEVEAQGSVISSGDFATVRRHSLQKKKVMIRGKPKLEKQGEGLISSGDFHTARQKGVLAAKRRLIKKDVLRAGIAEAQGALCDNDTNNSLVKKVRNWQKTLMMKKRLGALFENEPKIHVGEELSVRIGKDAVSYTYTDDILGKPAVGTFGSSVDPTPLSQIEGNRMLFPNVAKAGVTQVIEAGGFDVQTKEVIATQRSATAIRQMMDKNTLDCIKGVYKDACAQLYLPRPKIRMSTIRVVGSWIMLPSHLLQVVEDGDMGYLVWARGMASFEIDLSKVHLLSSVQDVVLMNCGARVAPATNLIPHFVSAEDISKFKEVDGALVSTSFAPKNICVFIEHIPEISLIKPDVDIPTVSYDTSFGFHTILFGARYALPTSTGYCGAMIVRGAHKSNNKGRIMGMHVSGSVTHSMGYCEIVTCDQLNNFFRFIGADGNKIDGNHLGIPQMQNIPISKDDVSLIMEKPGGISVYGNIPKDKLPSVVTKTEIKPSVIHGLIGPVQSEPSILQRNDKRLKKSGLNGKWDPVEDGVAKYGTQIKPFKKDLIQKVEKFLIKKFAGLDNEFKRREILNEEEMVNGVPESSYHLPIDMTTSPGYPYILSRKAKDSGKKYLFKEEESYANGQLKFSVENPDLKINIINREANACEGIRSVTIPVECAKDERRALKKIYDKPATRTFTNLPVDLNLLYRKYFLDFAACVMSTREKHFCKVGINPFSCEWTNLQQQWLAKSKYGFAGDYSKFDGIGPPELYHSIVNVINSWYNDGETCALARHTLVDECFHRYSLCNNVLVGVNQGMPSGFSMTVIFNSFVNYYFLAMCWFDLLEDTHFDLYKSIEDFDDLCAVATYGDDNVVAVNEEALEMYNLRTLASWLAEYGVSYTDEQKRPIAESEPFVKLTSVSFLKRSFRKAKGGYILQQAPLDKKSIEEQCHWIRESSMDEVAALMMNIKNAMFEASLHGEDYFDDLKGRVNKALKSVGRPPITTTYKENEFRWWRDNCTRDISDSYLESVLKRYSERQMTDSEYFRTFFIDENRAAQIDELLSFRMLRVVLDSPEDYFYDIED